MKQIALFFACLFMTSTSFLSANCSKCDCNDLNSNCAQNPHSACSSNNEAVSQTPCSREENNVTPQVTEVVEHVAVVENTEK